MFLTKKKTQTQARNEDICVKSQVVSFEVFKDHCKQMLNIFNKSLINDDDIQTVKNNLNLIINLLIDELNTTANDVTNKLNDSNVSSSTDKSVFVDEIEINSPIWNYSFKNNLFETIYLWSLSYPEYLHDLKYEQLKYFEHLLNALQSNEQTNLLLYKQLNRPLFSLLNHCATHNSELIENHMISILNQLCVCICKNSNLLNIFFEQTGFNEANSNSRLNNIVGQTSLNNNQNANNTLTSTPSSSNQPIKLLHGMNKDFFTSASQNKTKTNRRFFIFNILIPYIHNEGSFDEDCISLTLGQQARDALLMIMQLSSRNVNLARYIVDHTDFCPILATGLSALYSELPQKLGSNENFEEIRYLQRDDVYRIPALNKFINSLEFCNNVIQVSHSLIANHLLQYVYFGFLVPVVAPALTQNCMDEIIAATAYLDLFLRTINEPNLVKLFLKFILFSKFDERISLLDTLIHRINSNTKLSLITLMLFYTLLDMNSEDVMYRLIFSHMVPCKHLMKSQVSTLKQQQSTFDINNTQSFLGLSSNYNYFDNNQMTTNLKVSYQTINENTKLYKWLNTTFETNELNTLLQYLESTRFDFVNYLRDANVGICDTIEKTKKWSQKYDVAEIANESQLKEETHLSHDTLDYDAEEFLLNLNLFSSSLLNDSAQSKSNRSTQHINYDSDSDLNSLNESHHVFNSKSQKVVKKSAPKSSRKENLRTTTDDLFDSSILSNKNDKMFVENLSTSTRTNKLKEDAMSKLERKLERKQRRREKAKDFYILSFDNELSETSSSESQSESDSDELLSNHKVDKEDDDESTSLSSTATLNNELANQQPSRLSKSQSNELIGLELRQKLVDYLFANEESCKTYLNSNLSNFLIALDSFFQASNLDNKFGNSNSSNILCDQIMNIYNDLFAPNNELSNAKVNSNMLIDEQLSTMNLNLNKGNMENDKMVTSALDSSMNTRKSNDSNDSNQGGTDSGVESINSTSNQNDVGPFLCAIMNRLEHMLSNSLQINFLITGILARLSYYPQVLLKSFLLNPNLVMQPNVKSLIQVLTTIKFKIDNCAKTYEDFSLLYLKAKLFLVKRLIDMKTPNCTLNNTTTKAIENDHTKSPTSPESFNQSTGNNNNNNKKRSTMDKFINFFFKSSPQTPNDMKEQTNKNDLMQQHSSFSTPVKQSNRSFQYDITTPQVEIDLNDIKTRFTNVSSQHKSPSESIQLKQFNVADLNEFNLVDSDWEDVRSRNIAFSVVVFDEFIKELSAICQEHSVLTLQH